MSDSHEITILFATFYGYALHVINSLAVVIFIPLACHQTGRVLLMIQLHLWNPREPLSVSGNLIAYISWRLMTSINDCMSIFLPRTINPESKNVCISGIGKGEHTPLLKKCKLASIQNNIYWNFTIFFVHLPLQTPPVHDSVHEKSSQPASDVVINTQSDTTVKIICDRKNILIFILAIIIFL